MFLDPCETATESRGKRYYLDHRQILRPLEGCKANTGVLTWLTNIRNVLLAQDVEKTHAVFVVVEAVQTVEAAVEAVSMDGGKMLRGVAVAVAEVVKHALAAAVWAPRIAVDAGALELPEFSWRTSPLQRIRKRLDR